MKAFDRGLVVLCVLLLFAIARVLISINEQLSQHNRDQNKYSAIQNEYAKLISGTIAKTQLDIARIDDRWEKQRQEQAKHEKQVELFNLQLKRAKESERQSKE